VADTAACSDADLRALVPDASFVDADGLAGALAGDGTNVLVMPYGSAFPESAWPALERYLEAGHNLVVLGGRPFTRAAYLDGGVWKLRAYSVRFTAQLRIDQYEATAGSEGLKFKPNPDAVTVLPAFQWEQGFSPILHLSDSNIGEREGSAGRIDSSITAFAWGTREGRPVAAPAIEIDHLQGKFVGGRWALLNAALPAGFAGTADGRAVVRKLIAAAEEGAGQLQVVPTYPLYAEGEPVEVGVRWVHGAEFAQADGNLKVKVTVTNADAPAKAVVKQEMLRDGLTVVFPAPTGKGLRRIDAELLDASGRVMAVGHSAFWMRDEAYLLSGPKLTVNHDSFELNGKTLAVVGTTYMASDAQRLYYEHPNVYVWDKDLGEIAGAGLNMLRTGWWSGWNQITDENGMPTEQTLRTMEAYLMTARKYDLPVQFNVFAFLPDVLGGTNPWLDPIALEREKTLYFALASRFGKVPFLAWDLINEPSFGQYHWTSRANGDALELHAWNSWLRKKYATQAELAAAWNIPPMGENAMLPVPEAPRLTGVHDFFLFQQQTFADWAAAMRATIQAAGSQQLITVGQDEGGNTERLLVAYFNDAVDFTANHEWHYPDNLLWDTLVAKQPGKPELIQEMGVGSGLSPDGTERRDAASQAALFERKVVLSFAGGAGAIEWLWNTNADMMEDGEVALGGVRADRTEKPETEVLRGLAAFAKEASPLMAGPERPPVAIVTSQAAQFSRYQAVQNAVQERAVQALCYNARTPAYMVAENQVGEMGKPKLAILPSPQALGEPAWQALLAYVKAGGNLLITGTVDRNAYWQRVDRLTALGVTGAASPLTFRTFALDLGGNTIPMTFSEEVQERQEFESFADGKSFERVGYGQGKIYWSSVPVEMAEEPAAAGRLYAEVLKDAGVQPEFALSREVSPGVLIYPVALKDAVLYLFASTDALDAAIDLKDGLTGGRISFRLGAGRGAVVLLEKQTGRVVAGYGN
jgi:hypothetical protein